MTRERPTALRALLLALALAPVVLLVLEALARPLAPALSDGIHALGHPLCHQDPSRSPWAFGHALGACWRCVGVHLGTGVVALAWRSDLRFGDARAFPVLLGLGALDWGLCQAGLSMDAPLERLVTGAALGAGIALALTRAPRLVKHGVLARARVNLGSAGMLVLMGRAARADDRAR